MFCETVMAKLENEAKIAISQGGGGGGGDEGGWREREGNMALQDKDEDAHTHSSTLTHLKIY